MDPKDFRKNKEKEWGIGTGHSHHLQPVLPLDLGKVGSVNDLVKQMGNTSFGGRSVGEAADVLELMVNDQECYKVLTLSGAMTVAKMGLVICDMIDNGMVDAVVSTGALMAHGFIEAAGKSHFKYDSGMNDAELRKVGYDRVYDTLELETNLEDLKDVFDEVVNAFPEDKALSSYEINSALGKYLAEKHKGKRGVLKSAYEKKAPVYVPAFSDSELGLDFGLHNRMRVKIGKKPRIFDPMADLDHFADNIIGAKKIGIFTIGGGVPRNWAQQVAPYIDQIRFRVVEEMKGDYFAKPGSKYSKRYNYGVRICPEPVHWGGLSGCTYSEGVSWGKFVPKEEGGRWVEVLADATIAWPMIVKSVLERMKK